MAGIPKGVATLQFGSYQLGAPSRVSVNIKCNVEVMMVAFTTGNCRVRGTFLETVGEFVEGDTFGAKEASLTEEIAQIIRNFLTEDE